MAHKLLYAPILPTGARQLEFDVPVYPYHAFEGNSMITVHGVGLKMLGQAANPNGDDHKPFHGWPIP